MSCYTTSSTSTLASSSSSAATTPTASHLDIALQEDVLLYMLSMLSLTEIQRMRLVSKSMCILVNTKIVWLNCLSRLNVPLPVRSSRDQLAELSQPALERLAARAVRLDTNWRSDQPRPTSSHTIPLDSIVTQMAMCQGTLFTAHKDGSLRCWRDVDSTLSTRESSLRREDPRRFVTITPSSRILSFTHLKVCADPSRRAFVLAYIGDGLDRRTHCGVFSIPVDVSRHTDPDSAACSAPMPRSLGHFDESKGVVAIGVSPKSVVVAGSGGAISIIDIESGEKYSAHVQVTPSHLCQGSESVKILRLHVISEDAFLVLTSQAAMIYAIPSHQNPHAGTPVFVHTIPQTTSAWIQPSSPTCPDAMVTLLTTNSQILQFNVVKHREATVWSVLAQSEPGSAPEPTPFPYPVDRLSLTEMQLGTKRSVWVHWERGVDGWPLRILGGNARIIESSLNGQDSLRPAQPSIEFRELTAPDMLNGESKLSELVEMCTRSVSMPKICFDEGMGRLVMAGLASPSLVLCDFA